MEAPRGRERERDRGQPGLAAWAQPPGTWQVLLPAPSSPVPAGLIPTPGGQGAPLSTDFRGQLGSRQAWDVGLPCPRPPGT